jgi:hypothetical protein
MRPARRPMRGSGLGLAVESVPVGAGLAAPPLADEPPPQAAERQGAGEGQVVYGSHDDSSWGFVTAVDP